MQRTNDAVRFPLLHRYYFLLLSHRFLMLEFRFTRNSNFILSSFLLLNDTLLAMESNVHYSLNMNIKR